MRRENKEKGMQEEIEAINAIPTLKAYFNELDSTFEITQRNWDFLGGLRLIIPGTNYILSPWNGFDYGDEVIFLECKNLKKIHTTDIIGGPGVTVYEKINPNEPALMLYEYTGDGRYILYQI